MSHVKITDLSPVPFFARFLEGQFSDDLTAEEMKRLRGGASAVTLAYPSDSDTAEVPPGQAEPWPGYDELMQQARKWWDSLPGHPNAPGPGPFPIEPDNRPA
jgi:hypothetical protein